MPVEDVIYILESYKKSLEDSASNCLDGDIAAFKAAIAYVGEVVNIRDEIKSEIETDLSYFCFDDWGNETPEWKEVKAIIDKYKSEKEVNNETNY